MFRANFRFGALIVAAMTYGGCASSSTPDPFSQALRERGEIQINVMNQNFSDATLWVVGQADRRIRLGTVTGKRDGSFTIPWEYSEPAHIEIDLLAGSRCATDSMVVDPGDILELIVQIQFEETAACRGR
jgi:hypothetical protein